MVGVQKCVVEYGFKAIQLTHNEILFELGPTTFELNVQHHLECQLHIPFMLVAL